MLLTDSQGIGIDSAPVVLSCAAGKGPGSSRHRGSEGVWCSGALVCAFGGGLVLPWGATACGQRVQIESNGKNAQ